ncbi:MAG: phage holin family protein [Brevundimonas sp.]|jgi:putative membrane protein|uniref:phage holin family protein n=1 Tax=Brevundimonas sp. TaxID=1871086 RepID=UPI00391D2404
MVSFIVQVLVTALGLWLSDYLLAGITFTDTVTLLLASVILGVVNAFVRPVLVILTFPITVITLGLFLLVINAAMIGLTSLFLGGFVVAGLWPAIGAAIITGVVSWIASMVVRD